MKVLAASIIDSAQSFLHAGYISANPRPISSGAYPGVYPDQNTPLLRLDVAESLRLQGEQLASMVTGSADTTAALASAAATPGWASLVVGTLAVSGVAAAYCLLRERLGERVRRRLVAASAVAAALAIGGACGGEANGTPPEVAGGAALPADPPWTGVELRQYEDPQAATQVLLHGIIADALINIGRPVSALANIQGEVGLPTRALTEGERYALETYGIDGWGREFRLARIDNPDPYATAGQAYQVTSAGPDGVFDNEDDLSLVAAPASNGDFSYSRHAWFVAEHEGAYYVLYHRFTGSFFRYNHQELAKQLTASDLFDVFTLEDFYDESQRAAVAATHDEMAAEVSYSPLVLDVYPG